MNILQSQIIGEGNSLFILHGFLGSADNWRTMGLKFAQEGFQVHLIDQRNHGRSFHSNEFSYEILSNDLYNYMQAHNVNKASIIGHSMGGKTAMLFATLYPQKVEKLVVVDISPKYYPIHHRIIIQALLSVDFQVDKTRKAVEDKLSKTILDVGTRQFLMKNIYWKTSDELAFRFNLPALSENLGEIGKGLPKEAFYNAPTLFLAGEKSTYILEEDRGLIKVHFPDSEIITITNAGHWVQAENPTAFFQASFKFLNS